MSPFDSRCDDPSAGVHDNRQSSVGRSPKCPSKRAILVACDLKVGHPARRSEHSQVRLEAGRRPLPRAGESTLIDRMRADARLRSP